MNTYLRKIKKNSKALSPVVASIILIAVTVAVSVVVAAWMGGMTIGFHGKRRTNLCHKCCSLLMVQVPLRYNYTLVVRNNGGADASISKVYVNEQV